MRNAILLSLIGIMVVSLITIARLMHFRSKRLGTCVLRHFPGILTSR